MQAGNLVFIIIDRTQNTPLQSCEGSGQVEVRNHLVYVKVDAVTEHSDRRDRGNTKGAQKINSYISELTCDAFLKN